MGIRSGMVVSFPSRVGRVLAFDVDLGQDDAHEDDDTAQVADGEDILVYVETFGGDEIPEKPADGGEDGFGGEDDGGEGRLGPLLRQHLEGVGYAHREESAEQDGPLGGQDALQGDILKDHRRDQPQAAADEELPGGEAEGGYAVDEAIHDEDVPRPEEGAEERTAYEISALTAQVLDSEN